MRDAEFLPTDATLRSLARQWEMGEHDALFKRAFGEPAHAAAELASVLPAELVAALDLDALEAVPGSFVDSELVDRHTDLLFRTTVAGESEAFVYLLMEHQSRPDPLMPWRILVYMTRIWEQWRRDAPNVETLPAILPLVVHHGPQGWTAPTRFHDMIVGLDRVPGLSRFVPSFELCVDDLCTQADEDLEAREMPSFPKIALWLLRDVRRAGGIFEHVLAWATRLELIARDLSTRDDARALVSYILKAGTDLPLADVRRILVTAAPTTETLMISTADQLIEQTRQEMRKEGEQRRREAEQDGRREGRREALGLLLVQRFGALPAEAEAKLAAASSDTLDGWFDRILTGTSIDDVLAG